MDSCIVCENKDDLKKTIGKCSYRLKGFGSVGVRCLCIRHPRYNREYTDPNPIDSFIVDRNKVTYRT